VSLVAMNLVARFNLFGFDREVIGSAYNAKPVESFFMGTRIHQRERESGSGEGGSMASLSSAKLNRRGDSKGG
jgi:hypothetical protein